MMKKIICLANNSPLETFWAKIKFFHFYSNPEKSQGVLQNQQCIPKCLNSSHPDPGEKIKRNYSWKNNSSIHPYAKVSLLQKKS